jgi:hypothetical protein
MGVVAQAQQAGLAIQRGLAARGLGLALLTHAFAAGAGFLLWYGHGGSPSVCPLIS